MMNIRIYNMYIPASRDIELVPLVPTYTIKGRVMYVIEFIHDVSFRHIEHLTAVVADGVNTIAGMIADHLGDPFCSSIEGIHLLQHISSGMGLIAI